MKKSAALFCMFGFLMNLWTPLLAQRPTPTPSKPPTQPAKNQTKKTIPLAFDDLNDFIDKGLPAPADLPKDGNPDQAAILMARKISKLDKGSLPTLLTALQAAGFAIVDKNHKVLLPPLGDGRGQGLLFYDWETVGMLKLGKPGIGTSLDKLTAMITKDTPELPASRLSEVMLKDLRGQADSENQFVRFWARLIIELGKFASPPVDLMKAAPNNVNLSMLQATLWTRRLTAEIYMVQNRSRTVGKFQKPEDAPIFVGAADLHKDDASIFRPASFSVSDDDCQLTEAESLMLDAAAFGTSAAHDKIMELVTEFAEHSHDPGAAGLGKLSAGLFGANLALAWLKLVAAVTTMHGELTVEEPLPLIRTFNSTPGQRRLMKARFWSEVGEAQKLNCVRLKLIAISGLDFAMPTNGPLSEKAVEWHFAGDNETRVNDAATRNFEKFVTFESTGANRNPEDQVTDEEGVSEMYLVGAPKIPSVAESRATPVEKQANVLVGIRIKSAKNVKQNLIDIGGTALNVATSGPLALLIAVPELGFRLPYVGARATIPVTDHEPCDGQWQGTITYTYVATFRSNETISPGPPPPGARGAASTGGHKNGNTTITQSGTITVNGSEWLANSSADEVGVFDESHSSKNYCHGGLAGPIGPLVSLTSNSSTVGYGGGNSQGKIQGGISLDKDGYQISIKPLTVNGTFQSTSQQSTSGGCPPNKPSTSFSNSLNKQYGSNDYIVGKGKYGADRNILSGSDTKTVSTPGNNQSGGGTSAITVSITTVATITWNLRRCN